MNISLTPQLEDFVKLKLAQGGYQSASEVIRESLRLLAERDRLGALAQAKAMIASGLEQARHGELLDGEVVFARQRRRLVKKLRAKTTRTRADTSSPPMRNRT